MDYQIYWVGARAADPLCRAADAEPDESKSKRLRKEAIFLMVMDSRSSDLDDDVKEQLRRLSE
jgi:hypothetical protein